MQRRLDAVVRERDSTLTRAQEMSDKLLDVEKERDSLQVCCECLRVCICSSVLEKICSWQSHVVFVSVGMDNCAEEEKFEA